MNAEEHTARLDPERQPTHPGALLREDILPALNLSVTAAARALGVSRQTLHNLLSERVAVTPEMALRLGKLCGDGPGIWLRMQMAYDLWRAERRHAAEIAHIPTMTAV
jgi:addiction module HigA family antidote